MVDRAVEIWRVDNGYLVRVGCVQLVFTKEQLLTEFGRWVENPEAVELEYQRRYRGKGIAQVAMGIGEIRDRDLGERPAGYYPEPGPPQQPTIIGRSGDGFGAESSRR